MNLLCIAVEVYIMSLLTFVMLSHFTCISETLCVITESDLAGESVF